MGAAKLLGEKGIRTMFFRSLAEQTERLWLPTVAAVLPSDEDKETYRWLGQVSPMRQWTGTRHKTGLSVYEQVIANVKYEATMEMMLDDLRQDKTGRLAPKVQDFAVRAATLPQAEVTSKVLVANATAYDGLALFADRSAVKTGGSINNNLTGGVYNVVTPAAPTTEEMKACILDATQVLLSAKDDQGEPTNADSKSFVVMVPHNLAPAALGALRMEYTSAGVSNSLLSVSQGMSWTYDVAVNPRLTSSTQFYVMRTDSAVKGLIWQEHTGVQWTYKDESSDYAFDYDAVVYGIWRKGAPAAGDPSMIARATLS
jgi:phage major head subunit gpT-like protein